MFDIYKLFWISFQRDMSRNEIKSIDGDTFVELATLENLWVLSYFLLYHHKQIYAKNKYI